MFHPDVAEALSVHAIGDQRGRPFKDGKPPRSWSQDSVKRITLEGCDLTLLCGDNFEFEFSTRGHLIDFNFGDTPSQMRVNSDREQHWHFRPYMTAFAPVDTALYRRASDPEKPGAPHRLIGLVFEPEYLDLLLADTLDGRPVSFVEMSPPERWPRLDRVQSGLNTLFEAPHLFSRLTAEALANDAIMRALLRWSSVGNRLDAVKYSTDNQAVARAMDFIKANLTRPISLADIARASERDNTVLVHVFKLATGRTPYAYLISSRIDAAKRALKSTNTGIAEIGESFCFGSPSHFATTFRKLTGMTPKAYREMARK